MGDKEDTAALQERSEGRNVRRTYHDGLHHATRCDLAVGSACPGRPVVERRVEETRPCQGRFSPSVGFVKKVVALTVRFALLLDAGSRSILPKTRRPASTNQEGVYARDFQQRIERKAMERDNICRPRRGSSPGAEIPHLTPVQRGHRGRRRRRTDFERPAGQHEAERGSPFTTTLPSFAKRGTERAPLHYWSTGQIAQLTYVTWRPLSLLHLAQRSVKRRCHPVNPQDSADNPQCHSCSPDDTRRKVCLYGESPLRPMMSNRRLNHDQQEEDQGFR